MADTPAAAVGTDAEGLTKNAKECDPGLTRWVRSSNALCESSSLRLRSTSFKEIFVISRRDMARSPPTRAVNGLDDAPVPRPRISASPRFETTTEVARHQMRSVM